MLTPWNIPCEANTVRGQLKHSWLENQLTRLTIDDIIANWKSGIEWPELEREFQGRIKQTIELADNLAEGFSPKQLVDKLHPFTVLSISDKEKIKVAVHEAYLASSQIMDLQIPLKSAANGLGQEISRLQAAWRNKSADGETHVRKTWEQTVLNGRELLTIFDRLPNGVVLP